MIGLAYRALKPLLFSLDPETAHEVVTGPARAMLAMPGGEFFLRGSLGFGSRRFRSTVAGIDFPGPVGMAAGFDKTAELYPFLSAAGFHFVESGTFTPLPQDGNPKPRLFRYPGSGALINRMGFNNPGIEKARSEFAAQDRRKRKGIRGINIGKNKITPNESAISDYSKAFTALQSFGDYIAINISSPNTPGLRELQTVGFLRELLQELIRLRSPNGPSIFVKFAPDIESTDFVPLLEAALKGGAAGVILTNTTISRDFAIEAEATTMEGGLSGRPLFDRSNAMIRLARDAAGSDFAIIGVGGIDSGPRALAKILAGANLIQIYSGYIFQGPMLPSNIARFLDSALKKADCNLSDMVGQEARFRAMLKNIP